MIIFKIQYLKEEDIDSFVNLDKKVYKDSYQVDKETTLQRLKKNPNTDITVMDGGSMVGYISLCPVDERTFRKIAEKNISEKEVEENTLACDKPGKYKAYLSSMVIDKECYPWFKGKILIKLMNEHILKLRKKGIIITEIIAFAVSEAGKKTLNRYHFRESRSRENIYICHCSKNAPVFIIEKSCSALWSLLHSLKGIKWVSV